MHDCTNPQIGDLIPSFARGALAADRARDVREHLVICDACAAELVVVQGAGRVFAAVTPAVDIERIARMVPAAPGAASRPRVLPFARRRMIPRSVLAAAASLVIIGTLSLPVVRTAFVADTPAEVPTALVGGADLADLSVEDLATLLVELDRMEATILPDPVTLQTSFTLHSE